MKKYFVLHFDIFPFWDQDLELEAGFWKKNEIAMDFCENYFHAKFRFRNFYLVFLAALHCYWTGLNGKKDLESFTRVSADRNITRYLENRIWTGIWQSVDSSTTTGFWLIIGHVDFFRAPVELFVAISCIYGCQKWIPDKILHRNDNPIFF